ncbi:malate dehydrogenase (oxaloacetate-decarboxylating)(NADP+) [Desulfocicer vacuolatum DSM 3385]|uniref:Malate dehydrogenase (Oxaloacetate-decarboxylating)(NADP+) n=1 Tax=Desulfocicer vacuolatum DSM 3385 TaxID=1121400 RepID=A0A1W2EAM5_9BACT|nr:malic enzyme-like NAD(P)-binding protein [Desulfocicer vacuolatum]SMD06386.1 malate dehydrogenase (oxaloacetate-decarboxylating)(NADP+) [Desulfocicer vacuolatum DSM 3385]
MERFKKDVLNYHCTPVAGKIQVMPTKPCQTADDLSMAYTPGVALPVQEIAADPSTARLHTSRQNLVAVISNGTAILGLGNLGALASKPVMEGKGVLFKRFADVDVFDIELNTEDPKKLIDIVKIMEPTFGGVNLEDIKAPECFEIEETLIDICNIPVFHDDQHGTAIICAAGLVNALEITGKKAEEIKVVFNGAGAAGISCAKLFISLGVKYENLAMCDSRGVIYKGRAKGMNKYKEIFALDTDLRTLEDAMKGSDVFIGVSQKDVVTREMLLSMAKDPIVFAMANPDPEISYALATATRDDVIMATGRSDFPNQINNVLGFPYIFRGALDVGATKISEGMKLAAAKALAALAKEPVPQVVKDAYNGREFSFGKNYIVPKPFDPRVIEWESVAVAKAAIEEGLATNPIKDWDAYASSLRARMEKFWCRSELN